MPPAPSIRLGDRVFLRAARRLGFVHLTAETFEIEHAVEQRRLRDFAERAVHLRQIVRGGLADLGNGQRVQPARQREVARAFAALDKARGILLPEDARLLCGAEIERGELLLGEIENIERIIDQAMLDELVGDDAAEAFDIEGAAFGEIFEPARLLRGARGIFADPPGVIGVAPHGRAAGRAFPADVREKIEGLRVGGTFLRDHANDRGDDFAGLLDNDRIADADVFAADLVFIVQGGPRDRAAAEEDGLEFGDRGEDTGAADLDGDVAQDASSACSAAYF